MTANAAAEPVARISVIIPALNESACIQRTLESLAALRRRGHEVIVVDGGSADGTAERTQGLADRIIQAPRGRATQMNAGAVCAGGDILWFVHADTLVPDDADARILAALRGTGRHWGRFDIRLSGRSLPLRLVEALMNLRSCVTGIATGDQGIFVRRGTFEMAGCFPEIALMEDIALCRRLKAIGRPSCIRQRLVTSSRRWERHGVIRTILLMWRLRLAYYFGTDPEELARRYTEG